jgi:WD40 repeat protein
VKATCVEIWRFPRLAAAFPRWRFGFVWLFLSTAVRAAAPVTAIAFAPGGAMVVVGSQEGLEVRAWPSLELEVRLECELENIHDLAFSPDGTALAVAGGAPAERGEVEVFRWPERELQFRVAPHDDVIYSVAWRDDSAALVTASADRRSAVLNASDGQTRRYFEQHSRAVLAAEWWSRDQVMTAGVDGTIRIWHAERGEELRALSQHTGPVHDLAVQPGDVDERVRMAVSVSGDRTVRFWQPGVGRLVRFVRLESAPNAVIWSRDGKHVCVACADGRLRVIDPANAKQTHDLPAVDGVAHAIAEAPDGSFLVGGAGGALKVVRLQ